VLALMSGEADRSDYDRLRDFWRGQWGGEGFEDRWRKTLVDGVVEGSRPQAVPRPAAQLPDWTPPARQEGYAIVYRPDPSVFDGRFANNAWLQECPQPFSKAVWGNAIEMSPEDAAHAKIAEGGTHSPLPPRLRGANDLAGGPAPRSPASLGLHRRP
jgi:hypothetical protein